jgi:hypothetical protein
MNGNQNRYDDQQGPQHHYIGAAVAVGAIVGAGALGWRFRSQIGTGLRSVGEFAGTIGSIGIDALARSAKLKSTIEDVGTFAKSLHYAMDDRSIFSHMENPNRFEDRFNLQLQRSIESRARSAATPLGGEDLEIETELEELRTNFVKTPKAILENHRMEYVQKDLEKKLKDSSIDVGKDIMSHLVSNNGWVHGRKLNSISAEGFVDKILENNKDLQDRLAASKIGKDEFVNTLYSTLDRYRTLGSEGFNELGRRQRYRTVVNKQKHNMMEDFIKANKAKRNAFQQKVMANTGKQLATVED